MKQQKKRRALSLLLTLSIVAGLLPAISLPARAAEANADTSISKVDVDTLKELGFTDVDPEKMADIAKEQDPPDGKGVTSLFTVNELVLAEPGETNLYNTHGVADRYSNGDLKYNENHLPPLLTTNAEMKIQGPTYSDSTMSAARSVALDVTGSGKADHVAYISAKTDDKATYFKLTLTNAATGKLVAGTQFGLYSWPFKSYMPHIGAILSITAGDYDGDGKEEIAIYLPKSKDSGAVPRPSVQIYEYDESDKQLEMRSELWLERQSTGLNFFGENRNGNRLAREYPAVSLTTIKGTEDGMADLAIGVSYMRYGNLNRNTDYTEQVSSVVFWKNPMSWKGNWQETNVRYHYLSDSWNNEYQVMDPNDTKQLYYESMLFPGVDAGDLNRDGMADVVVAGYRLLPGENKNWKLDKQRYLITWYSLEDTRSEQDVKDGKDPDYQYVKKTAMQWIRTDTDGGKFDDFYGGNGGAIEMQNSFDQDNNHEDRILNPLVVKTFAERGTTYGDSVFVGGIVAALGVGADTGTAQVDSTGTPTTQHAPQKNDAPQITIQKGTNFFVRYAAPLRAADTRYTGDASVNDRTVTEATAGNFNGDPLGREQLVFSYMMQNRVDKATDTKDKAKLSTFVCSLNMTAGPDSSVKNLNWNADEQISKVTYLSADVWNVSNVENVRFQMREVSSRSRTPMVTVAAVDTDDDSILKRYAGKPADYYFSDPQIIAVLQAAPYFADLADGNMADSDGMNDDPSTAFTRTFGTTVSNENAVTVNSSMAIGATVAFDAGFVVADVSVLDATIAAKINASMGYLRSDERERSVSETFSASYTDSVALVMAPYVRHHYQTWNPTKKIWEPAWIDMPESPQTAIMSLNYYDSVAARQGWSTLRDSPDILRGTQPGYPLTYHGTMPSGVEWNGSALKGDDKTSGGFVSMGSGGGSITKTIEQSQAHANGISWGAGVGAAVDVSVLFVSLSTETTVDYTGGHMEGTFAGTAMEGSVPDVSAQYIGKYGFQWDFGSFIREDFQLTPAVKQDVLVLSYLVQGVKAPPRPPIDGRMESNTQTSVTLTWSDQINNSPERYEIARKWGNYYYTVGSKSVDEKEPGEGLYRFTEHELTAGTEYSYHLRTYGYSDGDLVASGWSTAIEAVTALENGITVTDPVDLSCRPGQSGSFSVGVSGGRGYQYQWMSRTGTSGKFENLEGQTGSTLTLENITQNMDQRQYCCQVWGTVNGQVDGVTSLPATLHVGKGDTTTTLSVTLDEANIPDNTENTGYADEQVSKTEKKKITVQQPVTAVYDATDNATDDGDYYALMQMPTHAPEDAGANPEEAEENVPSEDSPAYYLSRGGAWYQPGDDETIDLSGVSWPEGLNPEQPDKGSSESDVLARNPRIDLTQEPVAITAEQFLYKDNTLETPYSSYNVVGALDEGGTKGTESIKFADGLETSDYLIYKIGDDSGDNTGGDSGDGGGENTSKFNVYYVLDGQNVEAGGDAKARYFVSNESSGYTELWLGNVVWKAGETGLTGFDPNLLEATTVEGSEMVDIPTVTTNLGTEVTLTAHVKENVAEGAIAPTGRMLFLITNTGTGATQSLSAVLNSAGQASAKWRAAEPGTYSIVAQYQGMAVLNASSSEPYGPYTAVNKEAQSLSIVAPSSMTCTQAVPLSAQLLNPDGTVADLPTGVTFNVKIENWRGTASSYPFTVEGATLKFKEKLSLAEISYSIPTAVTVTASYEQVGVDKQGEPDEQESLSDDPEKPNDPPKIIYRAEKIIQIKKEPLTIKTASRTFTQGTSDLRSFTPVMEKEGVIGEGTLFDTSAIITPPGYVFLPETPSVTVQLYRVSLVLPAGVKQSDLKIGSYPIRVEAVSTSEWFQGIMKDLTQKLGYTPDLFSVQKYLADARRYSARFHEIYDVTIDNATLTVENPRAKVEYSAGFNGSLSATLSGALIPSDSDVYQGSELTFTAYPKAGYAVKEWTVADASEIPADQTITQTVGENGLNVQVSFQPMNYTLHYGDKISARYDSATGNPIASGSTAAAQSTIYFQAKPPEGQYVSQWMVNGKVVKNDAGGNLTGNVFTMEQLTGDATVSVDFAETKSYTVEVSAVNESGLPLAANLGEIDTAALDALRGEDQKVAEGGAFTVTAKRVLGSGYFLDRWEQKNQAGEWKKVQGNNPDYAVGNLTEDLSLRAVFHTGQSYTLTLEPGENGSLTARSGDAELTSGSYPQYTPITFTATPADNYTVDQWTVTVGAAKTTQTGGTSYVIQALGANTIVAVSFKTSGGGGGGGGGGGAATDSYAIVAEAEKGGSIDPSGTVTVTKGKDQTFTITPDEGYIVADVLADGKSVGPVTQYVFKNVTEAHAITAKFRSESEPCDGGTYCASQNYTDVDKRAWYHEAVDFALSHGLMSGHSATSFGPNENLTRAQLAQVLYNGENRPTADSPSAFPDVAADAWYADAVAWASQIGVVLGYGDGRYGPDDLITREQLATMLWRYAQYKEYDVSMGEDTNILSFIDAEMISEYAIPAMQWACGAGIMSGKGGGILDPRGSATRAEIATMLMNFKSKY